nr:MAG TPA: hypothetical protein [Caudoviricetes sp.]DAZ53729.1 MAG TPA: hypothetical protein [Caudoviricetes sp.]
MVSRNADRSAIPAQKLNGNLRFSLDEAIRIQETFFSDVSVNQLFRHE